MPRPASAGSGGGGRGAPVRCGGGVARCPFALKRPAVADLFASGRIVDLILALMAAEAVVLAVHYRRTGRGVPLPDLAVNLAAGAGLLLALRAALTGAVWAWTAGWLTLALAAHLADLARRWRG